MKGRCQRDCRRCGKRHLRSLLWAALPFTRYRVRQTAAFACLFTED